MEKWELYVKAYKNICDKYGVMQGNPIREQDYRKAIYYIVKFCITRPETVDYEIMKSIFTMHNALKVMIERLTPVEFMQLFPIKKEYDGKKYGVKDYYYTMEYINTLDPDESIQDALSFMMEYWNDDIHQLNMRIISNLSDLREYEGKTSIAEEWAEMNEISMYTTYVDSKGDGYMLDQYGNTKQITHPNPRRPKYLRLVK